MRVQGGYYCFCSEPFAPYPSSIGPAACLTPAASADVYLNCLPDRTRVPMHTSIAALQSYHKSLRLNVGLCTIVILSRFDALSVSLTRKASLLQDSSPSQLNVPVCRGCGTGGCALATNVDQPIIFGCLDY